MLKGFFDWFDPTMVDGCADTVAEVLGRNPNIPERRIEKVAAEVRRRAEILKRLVK